MSRGVWQAVTRVGAGLLLSATLVAQQPAKYTALDLYNLAEIRYVEPNPLDVKAKRAKAFEFPAWLKALDGKPVVIHGYMLPYDLSQVTVNEFMLMANGNTCCFTPPQSIKEYVYVTIKGWRAYPTTDEITVRGTFSVGEQFDEAGYVTSIFRINAEHID